MNYSDVESLRLMIYACQDATLPVAPHWAGVAELQAAMKDGSMETHVIRPSAHYSTRGVAIEAALRMTLRELMDGATRLPSQLPPSAHQQRRLAESLTPD